VEEKKEEGRAGRSKKKEIEPRAQKKENRYYGPAGGRNPCSKKKNDLEKGGGGSRIEITGKDQVEKTVGQRSGRDLREFKGAKKTQNIRRRICEIKKNAGAGRDAKWDAK